MTAGRGSRGRSTTGSSASAITLSNTDFDESLPQLDDFEIQLPEMAASLKLNVDDFLKIVSKKLGVPNLRHTPFRYISWPVLPSPVVSRRFERRKLELKALISVLRESDRSTGQAGKAALGEALADLAALENTEGKPGGGGLMLDKGFGLAKGLGSGYRRALLLAGQLLTHDLCLIDEPEIYLHPRMLERLLDFVVERSKSCQVVMTTHSPVVIDYLQQLPNVKMYEVTENAVTPNGQLVDVTSRSMRKVLGELGWRPAHLLQANAIVWVEGPSDVIYVQRWINLWARGRLRPQRDYVCISYGGSLLKHLIAGGADTIWDVNRNSILICDSDKDSPAANVPDYKLGMMTRFEAKGGYAWVTDAREIENYLPRRLLAQRAVVDIPEDYSYVDVPRMLGKDRKKSELAREIAPLLTRKDIEEMPPLAKQIDKICGLLTSWSRIV